MTNMGNLGWAVLLVGQGLTVVLGETLGGLEDWDHHTEKGRHTGSVLRRPLMWERPEDMGRAPGEVSWAGSTKDSHGAWLQRDIRIQSRQLALTGAEVSASGSCGPSQIGAPLALRKGPGPK